MRTLSAGLFSVAIFSLLMGCAGHGTDGTGAIGTGNYANETLNYYYYLPDSLQTSSEIHRTFIVCVGGRSEKGEDFVPRPMKRLADEFQLIIIAPTFIFDEDNWEYQKSYQFPAAWSGGALMRILDDFKQTHRYSPDGLLLFGAFDGADFCLRYSLLWPDQVKACAEYGTRAMVAPDISNHVHYLAGIPGDDEESGKAMKHFLGKARLLGMTVETHDYSGGRKMPVAFTRLTVDFFRDYLNHITRL